MRGIGIAAAVVGRLRYRSGSAFENDYVETALVADLPVPTDRRRGGCVTRPG